jgi:hypothetical protein
MRASVSGPVRRVRLDRSQGLRVSNAIRLAEIGVRRFGFALVKMNPAQNRFPMDSREVVAAEDRDIERYPTLGAMGREHAVGRSLATAGRRPSGVNCRQAGLTRGILRK